MPYVYSTATNDMTFTDFKTDGENNLPQLKSKVLIKGGANRATKSLVTPYGIPTQVTDDELVFLQSKPNFRKAVKSGFLTVRDDKVDAEVAVADMNKRDESAPAVPEDFGANEDGQPPKRFAGLQVKNTIE